MHRFLLAAPAAALLAVPAIAQAQVEQFEVNFAFDSAQLSQSAQRTIDQAVQVWRQGGESEVSIVGYTDTAGPSDYNQKLSERRARAVEQYMRSQGVPTSEITTAGRGENNLAVQTADGVPLQQNRRAVVALGGGQRQPVAQAAPQPAPQMQEEKPGLFGFHFAVAPYVGVGLAESDSNDDTVVMPGLNLTAGYDLTKNINFEAEQAIFYTLGAEDNGIGGRTAIGANLQTDFSGVVPYVGANVGATYADGSWDNMWFAGPEAGLRWKFLQAKVAYDIPISGDRSAGDGVISATLGAVFRF